MKIVSRFTFLRRLMVGCVLAAGLGMVAIDAKGEPGWLVSFTIDPAGEGMPPYAVESDNAGPPLQEHEYNDYRLGSGVDSDVNFCVEGSPNSTGLFIWLNRKLDGAAGFMRCDTPNHDYSFGKQRQYSIVIDNDSACWELGWNGYLSGDADTWRAGCRRTGGPNPRIRFGNLWAKTPRTKAEFLTTNPSGRSVTYVVLSDSNVSVVAGPTDTRTVMYGGTARLHKFAPNAIGAVAEPFPLPLHMTFARRAQ